MPKLTPNTILLRGEKNYVYKEYVAAATPPSPGHMLAIDTAGKVTKAGVADVMNLVALENDLIGKDIVDAYVAGDQVRCGEMGSGVEAYLRVAAAATAILIGDKIVKGANGTVKKWTAETDFIGTAMVALDNSAGGSEAFIKVKFK